MPVADRTPNVVPSMTDSMASQKVLRVLIQAIRSNRQMVSRLTNIVASAPGGASSVNTELGADATEVSAIIDKMVTLVNTHKATGAADITNPLV